MTVAGTKPPHITVQELLEITSKLGLRELAGLLRHRYPPRLRDVPFRDSREHSRGRAAAGRDDEAS